MYWTRGPAARAPDRQRGLAAHRRPVRLGHGQRAASATSAGSLLELSWNGQEPLTLADGSTRTFLEDGDEVTISATAPGVGGSRISFGEVTGRVQAPA